MAPAKKGAEKLSSATTEEYTITECKWIHGEFCKLQRDEVPDLHQHQLGQKLQVHSIWVKTETAWAQHLERLLPAFV
uniref:Uncharacterized protein n=1 Tax=Amazona collaria TaxID=241587 RepID=A0A8B9FIV4_9PSIT